MTEAGQREDYLGNEKVKERGRFLQIQYVQSNHAG